MQESEKNMEIESEEVPKINPKDRSFNFLMVQTAISILTVVFVLVLKVIGGDIYTYSRGFFDESFNKPINVKQVLSAEQTREVLTAQSTVYGAGAVFKRKIRDF